MSVRKGFVKNCLLTEKWEPVEKVAGGNGHTDVRYGQHNSGVGCLSLPISYFQIPIERPKLHVQEMSLVPLGLLLNNSMPGKLSCHSLTDVSPGVNKK